MGYLGKASVTDEPLDRILWYVTVLDALLGEKVPGFTGAMRRRLSNILATSEAEKKTVGNQFDEVYDFRSQLVHGKQYKKKARSDHLYEARELARQAITWFVDFVLFVDDSLRRRKVDYNSYPRRSELLAVLDHDGSVINYRSGYSNDPRSDNRECSRPTRLILFRTVILRIS